MPIKRLMQNASPQMPLIGRLRKGAPKGANKPGQDLSYFRFTSEHGDAKCEAMFKEVYGEQPQSIKVMLPYPGVDSNFDAWLELYKGKQLISRGDGETEFGWRDDAGNWCTGERPMTVIEGQNGHRKAGRLQVVLPDLARAGYMGLVQVQTSSSTDISTIYSRLLSYWEQSRGNLQGILFNLVRYQKAIRNPRDNKMYNKWLIDIIIDAEWSRMQLEAQRQQAYGLLQPSSPPAVPMLVDGATGEVMDDDWDEPEYFEPESEPTEPEVVEAETVSLEEKWATIEAGGGTLYQSHWPEIKNAFVESAKEKRETEEAQANFILELLEYRQSNVNSFNGLVEHVRKTLKVPAKKVKAWIEGVEHYEKRPSSEFIEVLLGGNVPKGNDATVIKWLNEVLLPF